MENIGWGGQTGKGRPQTRCRWRGGRRLCWEGLTCPTHHMVHPVLPVPFSVPTLAGQCSCGAQRGLQGQDTPHPTPLCQPRIRASHPCRNGARAVGWVWPLCPPLCTQPELSYPSCPQALHHGEGGDLVYPPCQMASASLGGSFSVGDSTATTTAKPEREGREGSGSQLSTGSEAY